MKFNYISNGKSNFFPKFCENSENYLLETIKPYTKNDEEREVINQYLHQEVKKRLAIKESILNADEIQGNCIFFQNAMASAVQRQRLPNWIKSHFSHLLKDKRKSVAGNAFVLAYESIVNEPFTGYLPQHWLEQHSSITDKKSKKTSLEKLCEEIALKLKEISAVVPGDDKDPVSKTSSYLRLAKTCLQLMAFIQTWKGAKNLILTLDELYSKAENQDAPERYKILSFHLPLIFTEIHGIKAVMAQYILKELGYPSAKNDAHIKRIIGLLKKKGLIQNYDLENDVTSNLIFLEIAQTLPESTGATLKEKIYYLDKLFWLLNNHNFYLHKELQKALRTKGKSQEKIISKLIKKSL